MTHDLKTGPRFAWKRPAYWTECRWPHVVLSAEQTKVIAEEIERWRPHVRRRALTIAHRDEILADDLEQTTLMMLWMWRAKKRPVRPDEYIRAAIDKRMLMTLRAERRARSVVQHVEERAA